MTQDQSIPAREADDVAERFVVDMAAADPIMATFAGIAGHEDRLPDLTPDGYAAREDLLRRARAEMQRTTPSDDRERVAQSSFLERADTELALSEAHQPQSRINVIDSAVHGIRGAFDLMATETADDWAAISARMGAVPQALADYRATLLHEADHGHVSPRRQMLEAAGQIRAWTGRSGSAGDVFAQQVAQAADVPATLESDLAKHAVEASAAYAEFATFLEQELAPRGRDKEAVGREQYARDSRYFLGTEIDLDETYAWGWEELHRIETEMLAISATLAGAGATIADAVAVIESDPARRIDGAEHVPRVDAGPRRPDPRRHGRHPLRHPRAGAADRVPDRADPGRRHLLHAALGGLHPAGADVVVDPRRRHDVPPVARGDHRLPRGRPGPSPPVRRRPPTARTCSTAGSAACAGSPATARAGRSTPSG